MLEQASEAIGLIFYLFSAVVGLLIFGMTLYFIFTTFQAAMANRKLDLGQLGLRGAMIIALLVCVEWGPSWVLNKVALGIEHAQAPMIDLRETSQKVLFDEPSEAVIRVLQGSNDPPRVPAYSTPVPEVNEVIEEAPAPEILNASRAAEPTYYEVKRGDTLYRIAQQHGTDVGTLQDINDIRDASRIYVGQRIKLP